MNIELFVIYGVLALLIASIVVKGWRDVMLRRRQGRGRSWHPENVSKRKGG